MSSQLMEKFLLAPDIVYLNFGSYGACAKPVFEDYQCWQRKLEANPYDFIRVKGAEYLSQSRKSLGRYLNCDGDDLVYLTNPSYAVNIVARSLNLGPGDEVLTTDLEYGACDRTWKYYCSKAGAKYIRRKIELPLVDQETVIHDLFSEVSPHTKLIFISHITSVTALILPVQEICRIAGEMGIMTFVDGAHAPGQIQLDLSGLGADIYTGACHKWMLTPKSCSFLYVKKALQGMFDPLVISWGYDSDHPSSSQFIDYHEMQGTRDFSAFLTVPASIKFMEEHNWAVVSQECREMVKSNARRIFDIFGTRPISPINDGYVGQMLSIPVNTSCHDRFQLVLLEKYKIEIPFMQQNGVTYLRCSVNGFNSQSDLDHLCFALESERGLLS